MRAASAVAHRPLSTPVDSSLSSASVTPRNANPLAPVFPSESEVSSVRMLTVWSWLKKLGGVLRVPRPRHPGNDPEAAEKFK